MLEVENFPNRRYGGAAQMFYLSNMRPSIDTIAYYFVKELATINKLKNNVDLCFAGYDLYMRRMEDICQMLFTMQVS